MEFNLNVHNRPIVFTSMSSKNLRYRLKISKYIFENNYVPINGLIMFEHLFYTGLVDEDLVQDANNDLIVRSDEMWVFGDISDGVLGEIFLAQKYNKVVRYFDISQIKKGIITEVKKDQAKFEDDVKSYEGKI